MKLVSLELSKAERKQEAESSGPAVERPLYPYGTSMYLSDEALQKLGISEMPVVGTVLKISGVAKVTGTSEREYEGGSHKTLDIQFVEMACEESEEAEKKQTFDGAAKTLYGGKKG